MATVTLTILDDVCHKYPVDLDRIVLLGISGGGSSCWRMLAENPDRFAAVVPTGSAGYETNHLDAIPTNVPIWAFHYNKDRAVPIKNVRETVAALRLRGVPVVLTEFSGNVHSAWEPAMTEMEVIDWMLLQRRGQYLWYPPGMAHWPHIKKSFLYGWFAVSFIPILLFVGIIIARYDRIRKFKMIINRHHTKKKVFLSLLIWIVLSTMFFSGCSEKENLVYDHNRIHYLNVNI